MKPIVIKRIYEMYQEEDGFRILTDRLWPRGVKKENAHLDEWNKQIAPSTELRKWFDHKPERLKEFALRYREELLQNAADELQRIRKIASGKKVTLLYAAKNPECNHAMILRDLLNSFAY